VVGGAFAMQGEAASLGPGTRPEPDVVARGAAFGMQGTAACLGRG
jgi:hypothetical protein